MSAPSTPVQQYHHYLPGARPRSCARCGQPVVPTEAHYHVQGLLLHRACYLIPVAHGELVEPQAVTSQSLPGPRRARRQAA